MNSPSNNPYQEPSSAVAGTGQSGSRLKTARKVPAGNGVTWLSEGWTLFMRAPAPLLLMFFLYLIISSVLGVIPLVNMAAPLLMTILLGGVFIAFDRLDREGSVRFEDLFAGFNNHATPLALLGLILAAATYIGFGIMMVFGMGAIMGGAGDYGAGSLLALMLGLVLGMGIIVLADFLVFYAAILVVLDSQDISTALKNAFNASMINMMPFLMFSVAALALLLASLIPAGLIWLATASPWLAPVPVGLWMLLITPVMFAAIYKSYNDIFVVEME